MADVEDATWYVQDRGLIGLYKALGYSRGRILSNYAVYVGAACLTGGLIGDFFGFIVLPAIIFTIFSTMYALPAFTYHVDMVYSAAAIVLLAAGIMGATIATCAFGLRESPAFLMRPKAPKAGSRILLESICLVWRRMGFLNKVTARNIFRYKRRSLMTVFGIAGCVALLICGFGIRDTVLSLSGRQYGDAGVQRYDVLAVTNYDDLDAVSGELAADARVAELQRICVDSLTASFGQSSEPVALYVVPDGCDLPDYIGLADDSGAQLSIGEDGCIITKSAEQLMGLAVGDAIHVQDATLAEAEATGVAMSYLGDFIYMSEFAYKAAFSKAAEQNGLLERPYPYKHRGLRGHYSCRGARVLVPRGPFLHQQRDVDSYRRRRSCGLAGRVLPHTWADRRAQDTVAVFRHGGGVADVYHRCGARLCLYRRGERAD
ncbi:ABC transporter permease [Paratractidigestivibacter sp.]|uniref:ABC transporter permease n=1 Tax=Paratractidigestivibacter sp. TaxID=2847316 RepID=UPI002AC92974|nr:ABC transporter permease [Paratractidigestivibacter sp.]